ncbi:DUF1279 superfamily [Polyrhizophydium stewartii]|uniref:DUF1279 superfamily n=1 Tax=Polyrhizophydium stewartii TaxID=2732419 RepID=A0ABR4NBW9_9FUNG
MFPQMLRAVRAAAGTLRWSPLRRAFSAPPTQQPASPAGSGSAASKPRGLKLLFKEYGPVAFITYTTISCISVAAVYFGVDVTPIVSKMDDLKRWWYGPGHDHEAADALAASQAEAAESAQSNKTAVQSEWDVFYSRMGTCMLVALAGHKIIFPLRAGLTALLTPPVARFMRANNLEFWMRSTKAAASAAARKP